MKGKFVLVTCDVHCDVHDWDNPPRYRAYVSDELFTERTWIWENAYLEETFQIRAKPGVYHIRYEIVDPSDSRLWVDNFRIRGEGSVDQQGQIKIT
jgi:hypothetical protein